MKHSSLLWALRAVGGNCSYLRVDRPYLARIGASNAAQLDIKYQPNAIIQLLQRLCGDATHVGIQDRLVKRDDLGHVDHRVAWQA